MSPICDFGIKFQIIALESLFTLAYDRNYIEFHVKSFNKLNHASYTQSSNDMLCVWRTTVAVAATTKNVWHNHKNETKKNIICIILFVVVVSSSVFLLCVCFSNSSSMLGLYRYLFSIPFRIQLICPFSI